MIQKKPSNYASRCHCVCQRNEPAVGLIFILNLGGSGDLGGRLHILNAASPVSARKTRVFSSICRNFDRDALLQDTLDFNHQVFAEDKAIVEQQFPEDLPINLQEEVHIRADKSSITYRQGLAKLGLGRCFTA
jgi:hypothetical protein